MLKASNTQQKYSVVLITKPFEKEILEKMTNNPPACWGIGDQWIKTTENPNEAYCTFAEWVKMWIDDSY